MNMESLGSNFENLHHDTGFQPEVVSPELPLRDQFEAYVKLLEASKRGEESDAYHDRLIEHYRKMADLIKEEMEKGS